MKQEGLNIIGLLIQHLLHQIIHDISMAAGKDFSEDASAAVKKATNDMTAAAKKAATAK